jgi:chorismate dehydratase
MTVRLYATHRVHELHTVFCDTDSHTSVALMRIVLRESFGVDVQTIDYDAREHVAANQPVDWPPAMLLIGDKVVTDSPPAVRYPFQLDLGAEWQRLTGLPFVFALWLARRESPPVRLATAAAVLDRQRRANRARLDSIIHHRAVPRRWPRDLAASYLKDLIDFDFSDSHVAGLHRFFELALKHGLIDRCRDLEFVKR